MAQLDNSTTSPSGTDRRNRFYRNVSPVNQPPQAGDEIPGIPAFDLADQIMASQRRITSARRMSPAAKQPTPIPIAPHAAGNNDQPMEDVIAQIVARDIERMCAASCFSRQG